MKTPIFDFVKSYASSSFSRLHMPGHKGYEFLGCEKFDITEFEGADSLFDANGIILESENNASELFSSRHTFYSAEGSSLCIRAMLYLCIRADSSNERPIVAAFRNAHKTFMYSAALLDFDISWIYGENSGSICSCIVNPEQLHDFLSGLSQKPCAVYVTSPDYLGVCADIRGLSEVCHRHGVPLIVDNAHGAYLKFLPQSRHPIDLGADMCCDSAHKTLSALTGGAYLHVSQTAPDCFFEGARDAMALFASTSPSYLILQSLDLTNKHISDGYRERLAACSDRVQTVKQKLAEHGFELMGDEPLKLTIHASRFGYSGIETASILKKNGVMCEYADCDFVDMMFTPENSTIDFERITSILTKLERRQYDGFCAPLPEKAKAAMSVRQAMFARSEELPYDLCVGRILASANVSCPPAIPIVVCGEIISKCAAECFKYYGIKSAKVVIE